MSKKSLGDKGEKMAMEFLKKKGMEMIERLKDVEGIIIDSDGLVIYSSGVKSYIHN